MIEQVKSQRWMIAENNCSHESPEYWIIYQPTKAALQRHIKRATYSKPSTGPRLWLLTPGSQASKTGTVNRFCDREATILDHIARSITVMLWTNSFWIPVLERLLWPMQIQKTSWNALLSVTVMVTTCTDWKNNNKRNRYNIPLISRSIRLKPFN